MSRMSGTRGGTRPGLRSPRAVYAFLAAALLMPLQSCSDSQAPRVEEPASTQMTTTTVSTPSATVSQAPASTTTHPATSAPATSVTSAPGLFTDGPNIVLFGDTADDSIAPGGIVFHEGQGHMFVQVEHEWLTDASIWWYTSEAGDRWEARQIVSTDAELNIPYTERTFSISSATVLDDGTWALWFHTIDHVAVLGVGNIGRLTAPGPEGPWTADPIPALTPGASGAWDSGGVGHPDVIRVGDEYWMYYDGVAADGENRSIGLARSSDGNTWAKHDDPATTALPLAESDPVLTPAAGRWDEAMAYDGNVVSTDDGFAMVYSSAPPRPDGSCCSYQFGVALSGDGVQWEQAPANPMFSLDRRGFIWTGQTELIFAAGSYRLIANLEGGESGVNLWSLEHTGELSPSS